PPDPDKEGEGKPKDGAGSTKAKPSVTVARSKPGARPAKAAEVEMTPVLYYKKVQKMKWSEVVAAARQALAKRAAMANAPRGRTIADIMSRSMGYSGQPVHGQTSAPPTVVYSQPRPAPAPATGLIP